MHGYTLLLNQQGGIETQCLSCFDYHCLPGDDIKGFTGTYTVLAFYPALLLVVMAAVVVVVVVVEEVVLQEW